jgi:hypothetical protein
MREVRRDLALEASGLRMTACLHVFPGTKGGGLIWIKLLPFVSAGKNVTLAKSTHCIHMTSPYELVPVVIAVVSYILGHPLND